LAGRVGQHPPAARGAPHTRCVWGAKQAALQAWKGRSLREPPFGGSLQSRLGDRGFDRRVSGICNC